MDWSTCAAVERDTEKVSGSWVFRGTRVPTVAEKYNWQPAVVERRPAPPTQEPLSPDAVSPETEHSQLAPARKKWWKLW